MDRSVDIKGLRPNLELNNTASTDEETFQNEVLRPILKYQNEVLQQYFLKTALISKPNFIQEEVKDRRHFIEQKLSKDAIIRNTLIGMVSGLMTAEELGVYLENEREYKRRIISMLVDRLLS